MTPCEEITKIYEDFGQLHENDCELNFEGGSFDGCTCAVKSMVKEILVKAIDIMSYDFSNMTEAQRKSACSAYENILLDIPLDERF